ncbi:ATP-binding protein [Rhizobium sp. TRM95111]|uniref:AAA family ATPase n=1 Tax=Rhizobium alarense TaxID=2846851 RepID=UPI001F19E74A|nr:ATP-binding protein [Rhizobium alarense]MCF3640625.1 ATP-binding protein [Rhizobium alarense]
MFLKHLQLTNIRCFADASLDFDLPGGSNRKWTVLLGENGTGKSTVLKAVALAMLGTDAIAEHLRDPNEWIREGAEEASIRVRFETKKAEEREVTLVFRRGETTAQFLRRSFETGSPLDDALEHTSRSFLTIGYGASRRLAPASVSRSGGSGPFRHPRALNVASLFDREAELNPLESWAMQLDYQSNGERLSVVSEVLSDFLPDMTFSHIDKEKSTLIFDTADGPVSLRQLSDGFQNVAAWIGDLLFQVTEIFEDFKSPMHARGLLIIDEVDLHLHPKWQRRLIDFLTAQLPNMQLLVTTHSVVTAQQAAPGALHYCIRRDRDVRIEPFTADPRTMLLNQLIATEAFGNASDESLQVEHDKEAYRALHRKETKSAEDMAHMAAISERLGQRPESDREQALLKSDQIEILRKLEETLAKARQ